MFGYNHSRQNTGSSASSDELQTPAEPSELTCALSPQDIVAEYEVPVPVDEDCTVQRRKRAPTPFPARSEINNLENPMDSEVAADSSGFVRTGALEQLLNEDQAEVAPLQKDASDWESSLDPQLEAVPQPACEREISLTQNQVSTF